MPLVPVSASLDANGIIAFLGQDDRNEVHHHFPCHVMQLTLVLASHDAISILNVIIIFLRSRQSKLDITWFFWSRNTTATGIGIICHWCWCHKMPIRSVLASHDANSIINDIIVFLRERQLKLYAIYVYGHVTPLASATHNTNDIISGTTTFLKSRQLKWDEKWLSWSCDTTEDSVSITWYWSHHYWHHCISQVKAIEIRCNIPLLVM